MRQALAKVPDEVLSKYYGCGSPLPMGIEGLRYAPALPPWGSDLRLLRACLLLPLPLLRRILAAECMATA